MTDDAASMTNDYLFILCPPFSGSTVLWKLLSTSPAVSTLPVEGQYLDSVRKIMCPERWNPDKPMPWREIKAAWEAAWDLRKPVLLEKSPPNIVRAIAIEENFQPAFFIAMIRNPYALCESFRRRRGLSVDAAAQKWVTFAGYQCQNIAGLQKVIHFTYEEFTTETASIKERILRFMPQLRDINITETFRVHSSEGNAERYIENLNAGKIGQLAAADIERINAVLQEHGGLMQFFGYDFILP